MSQLPDDLQEIFEACRVLRSRGSGPGGQHRNVCESRITLDHLPSGLRVVCDDTRSQHRNLRQALETLRDRLAVLNRPRKVRRLSIRRPKGVQRRILESKRRRSETKQMRQRPRHSD
jgi:peptide chain release factor